MKESFYRLDKNKFLLFTSFDSSSEIFEWRATDELPFTLSLYYLIRDFASLLFLGVQNKCIQSRCFHSRANVVMEVLSRVFELSAPFITGRTLIAAKRRKNFERASKCRSRLANNATNNFAGLHIPSYPLINIWLILWYLFMLSLLRVLSPTEK